MAGKRAIKAEQKEARREEILQAAFALYTESSFEDVSIAAVARKAGVAKGTIYLYFQTKEEIYLAIGSGIFEQSFDRIDRNLLAVPDDSSVEAVVSALGNSLENDPIVLRLISIIHAILEKNVPFDTILEFKQKMRRRLVYSAGLIEEKLTFLSPGQGFKSLMVMHALLVGFQQMADPNPTVLKVLETPGMELFKIDLAQYMGETMYALFKGMEAVNSPP
ncbi:MAG: TetR/AcrR family transcriptional regulator [Alphaproteobacteria bacterium]|nr:TetR/AcrR family transcriptional regulator [Rhodospirillales bacterium]MCW9045104.1 TetR/AcrR family transcriptional regulator [Alphaproteobacteria bacterium]